MALFKRQPDPVQRGLEAEIGPFSAAPIACASANPLRQFFDARSEGRGIWKWLHYFDIYDRHFSRFRGEEVHVLEIGVYSGGSLEMWRDYFGPRAHIYGVDVAPECRAYETDRTRIFIGDQADRGFWARFRREVPQLDIVIDDGGHEPEQQIISLEELLPHLQPSGVYVCEDVNGKANPFSSYVHGLAHRLNGSQGMRNSEDDERRVTSPCSLFQAAVDSVHLYPFMTIIERISYDRAEFRAPKRGTLWQPFLK